MFWLFNQAVINDGLEWKLAHMYYRICTCSWSCGRWVWNFSQISVYIWGPILFDPCIVSIRAQITWRGRGYVNKFPDFLRLSWERCLELATTDSPGDRFVVPESFLNLMRLCIFDRIRQWQLSALRPMGETLPVLDLVGQLCVHFVYIWEPPS